MSILENGHAKRMKRVALLTVLSGCFLATLAMPSKVEAATQCKSQVAAYSKSATRSLARRQARMVWRALVIQRHGPNYAIWRLGKNRSSSCKSVNWGLVQRCTVRAEPCR